MRVDGCERKGRLVPHCFAEQPALAPHLRVGTQPNPRAMATPVAEVVTDTVLMWPSQLEGLSVSIA